MDTIFVRELSLETLICLYRHENFAIMAMMAIFAIALMAVAPSVQLEVQREKEL